VAGCRVYHFDFFRLEDQQAAGALGSTITFWRRRFHIEWADRFPELDPSGGKVECVPDEIRTRARDWHKMKVLALVLSRRVAAWHGSVAAMIRWYGNGQTIESIPGLFETWSQCKSNSALPDTIIVGLGPVIRGSPDTISAAIGCQTSSHAHLVGFPSNLRDGMQAKDTVSLAMRGGSRFSLPHPCERMMEARFCLLKANSRRLDTLDETYQFWHRRSFSQFERVLVRYPSALFSRKSPGIQSTALFAAA